MLKKILMLTTATFLVGSGQFTVLGETAHEGEPDIHFDSILVDGHEDTPMQMVDSKTWLPSIDIGNDTSLDNDIPKAKLGGLDAPFLAAYTSGYYNNKARSTSRIFALINGVHWTEKNNPEDLEIASTVKEINNVFQNGKIAAVPTIEGAYSIEEDNATGLLEQYHDLGVAVLGLTWSHSNNLGEGVNEAYGDGTPSKGGLTDLGKEVMDEMAKLGTAVDVSHMSENMFWDVIDHTEVPIIATHSSAKALTNAARNLTDDQLKAVAENGGVVGINFYTDFIKSDEGPANLNDIVNHIDHAVKIAGINHVGLGSDFDGATMPEGLQDASDLPKLTDELINRGYTDEEIEKILGKNTLRVLDEIQKSATASDDGKGDIGISITPDYQMGEIIDNNTPSLTASLEKDEDTDIDKNSLRVIVDGIEHTPNFSTKESVMSLELKEPLSEKYHAVTFKAKNHQGEVKKETRIFYVEPSAENIKKLVERYEKEGSIKNEQAARALKMHLKALKHYEKQGDKDKVIKHSNGFKKLLNRENDSGNLSEKTYVSLRDNIENLLGKYN